MKPWRSGHVQSSFTPVSFELVRSLTHHFRFIADLWGVAKVARASSSGPISRICRRLESRAGQTRMVWLPSTSFFPQIRDEPHFPGCMGAIRSKKRRIGAENGGLDSLQDCRAIYLMRSWIGDNTRVSTHPPWYSTLPNQSVHIAASGNKSRKKKISRNWMIFITPASTCAVGLDGKAHNSLVPVVPSSTAARRPMLRRGEIKTHSAPPWNTALPVLSDVGLQGRMPTTAEV